MKNLILAFFAMVLTVTVSAQYDPKALEILETMSKKYKAIPAFEANISYTLTNDVEKINEEKRKLEVMVKIFGRKTPLELSFMQVEKV